MTGPCPHYNETEKTIGDLTLLVCRDCGSRLAADTEVIDDPEPEALAVEAPAVFFAPPEPQSPDDIQAVIDSAFALGILEEPGVADEGVEHARIERVDGELTLVQRFASIEAPAGGKVAGGKVA